MVTGEPGWVRKAQRGILRDARGFLDCFNSPVLEGDPATHLFTARFSRRLCFSLPPPFRQRTLPTFETSQNYEGPRTLAEKGGTSVKFS